MYRFMARCRGYFKYLLPVVAIAMPLWFRLPSNAPKIDALLFTSYVLTYTGVLIAPLFLWRAFRDTIHGTGGSALITVLGRAGRGLAALIFSGLVLFAVRYYAPSPPCVSRQAPSGEVSAQSPIGRIFLLAMDGVDPEVLTNLSQQGMLPHLTQFLDQGAYARLKTISPHSPVVWTSIVTGVDPARHGISGYYTPYFKGTSIQLPGSKWDVLGRGILDSLGLRTISGISSRERRAPALWELLSRYGVTSRFVNWWGSFPVDAIQGEIISSQIIPWDTLSKSDLLEALKTDQIMFPETLKDELEPLITEWGNDFLNQRLSRDAFSIAGNAYYRQRDDLMFRIFLHRIDDRSVPARVNAVYLQGVDTASHAFSQLTRGYNTNKERPLLVPEETAESLWRELVVSAYLSLDQKVGQILHRRKPEDIIIVISDHGWRYDGTSHWRLPDGVFTAVGQSVRSGTGSAHVFDILPTIMHLLDLPLARDLPGKPLTKFLDEQLDDVSTQYVHTYGCRIPAFFPWTHDALSNGNGEVERLRGLGYL